MNPIKVPKNGVTIWGQKTFQVDTINIKGPTEEELCLEVCDKCNGTGADPNFKDVKENNKCKFCNGTGKVEWLDKLYNRPKRRGIFAKWSMSIDPSQDMQTINQAVADSLAQEISNEIDKEILELLTKEAK